MVILKYCIEPGHGWHNGEFDAGSAYENLLERDLSWKFAKCMHERLEENGIRHQLLDNRVYPGCVRPPLDFCVSIHFSAREKLTGFQSASIQESPISVEFAKIIDTWGRITSPRWNGVKIRKAAGVVCRVEAFDLLELDALLLAERIPQLAYSLSDYLSRATVRSALRVQ